MHYSLLSEEIETNHSFATFLKINCTRTSLKLNVTS